MNSSLVRKALTNGARTSVGNYNLNTQTLGNCFLTLPPLEEQLQILNFIRSESQKFDDLININAIQISSANSEVRIAHAGSCIGCCNERGSQAK